MAQLRVEAFNERFRPDPTSAGPCVGWARSDTLRLFECEPILFTEFMSTQARSSYEGGLIRFLGPQARPDVFSWNATAGWASTWPVLETQLTVFAFDWMGRLYGLDRSRVISREPLVGRLDPGEGKLRHSDLTFAEFVLGDLVMYGERLLSADRFERWRAARRSPGLDGDEVVGYVAPLFNAGTDAPSNMELVRVEEYVARMGIAFAARHGLHRRQKRVASGGVMAAIRTLVRAGGDAGDGVSDRE